MLAIGNGELDGNPDVGKTAACPFCKEQHNVLYGTSKTMNPDGTWSEPKKSDLGYVVCPKNNKTYMVSLNGKLLFGPKIKTADEPYKGCCGD